MARGNNGEPVGSPGGRRGQGGRCGDLGRHVRMGSFSSSATPAQPNSPLPTVPTSVRCTNIPANITATTLLLHTHVHAHTTHAHSHSLPFLRICRDWTVKVDVSGLDTVALPSPTSRSGRRPRLYFSFAYDPVDAPVFTPSPKGSFRLPPLLPPLPAIDRGIDTSSSTPGSAQHVNHLESLRYAVFSCR